MIFEWFAERRRHRILEEPFPAAWIGYLEENMPLYESLDPEEQQTLRNDLHIFLREKNWEGCGGLDLTEEIQVTIAGQACLLLLNLEHNFYPNVESVLVYPSGYNAPQQRRDASGVVDEHPEGRLGEAWHNGPIVISWWDAKMGGANPYDGHNVVLHEFAHKLDLTDGSADGVPKLETDAQYDAWAEVLSAEYQNLVAQSEKGHATLLDHYGATNGAEFFAVATECFFEKSVQMREKHTRLYEVFRDYYHQDTAARMEAWKRRQAEKEQDSPGEGKKENRS